MSLPKYESLEEYLDTQPQDSYRPEKHNKGWGHEEWIANNELYCGKVLVLEKDKKCSIHYHVDKDETFYIADGEIKLHLIYKDGKKRTLHLTEGDCYHVTPGLMHQFEGVASKTYIIEFSTQHFESDSYRVERGD